MITVLAQPGLGAGRAISEGELLEPCREQECWYEKMTLIWLLAAATLATLLSGRSALAQDPQSFLIAMWLV